MRLHHLHLHCALCLLPVLHRKKRAAAAAAAQATSQPRAPAGVTAAPCHVKVPVKQLSISSQAEPHSPDATIAVVETGLFKHQGVADIAAGPGIRCSRPPAAAGRLPSSPSTHLTDPMLPDGHGSPEQETQRKSGQARAQQTAMCTGWNSIRLRLRMHH